MVILTTKAEELYKSTLMQHKFLTNFTLCKYSVLYPLYSNTNIQVLIVFCSPINFHRAQFNSVYQKMTKRP